MIEREILIANTKTQRRSKVTTNATTLGELKSALDAAGIDYSGMTFTEGISKTQLLDNATQLPQNVIYKGQPTNNLVILLTNTKKNIASGIHAADRQAAYSIIKERGLQEEIKETLDVTSHKFLQQTCRILLKIEQSLMQMIMMMKTMKIMMMRKKKMMITQMLMTVMQTLHKQ